jgi:hypothetical protein
MKKSRFTDSQILAVLKQVEAGTPVPQLCREHGISSAMFYKWRSRFGNANAQNLCVERAVGRLLKLRVVKLLAPFVPFATHRNVRVVALRDADVTLPSNSASHNRGHELDCLTCSVSQCCSNCIGLT